MIKTFIALLTTVLTTSAFAQQAAPAAPVTPKPAHNCVKPEYPGRLSTEHQRRMFTKTLDLYTPCMKKFAADQETISKAAYEAYSAAIKEYNDFIAELNKAAGVEDKDSPSPATKAPSSGKSY